MAKNEIVKADKFNLMTISGDLAEAVAEEMDGLGALTFDRVKIPSGGGISFELPGEDEDNPESSPSLVGVILDHYPVNAYWRDKYSGGSNPPDCSSFDGKRGADRETGEIRSCDTCPYNQFGSDGRGKACKNLHRVVILREGNPVPIILALPPTSIKSMRDYIGKKILLKGLRCYQAITRITLRKETNADGITYSRAVFTFQDALSPEQTAQVESMRTMTRAVRQLIDIDESEYVGNYAVPCDQSEAGAAAPAPGSAPGHAQQPPAVDMDGFMNVPEGELEVPFA